MKKICKIQMCKMTLTETKVGFLLVNSYLKLTWKPTGNTNCLVLSIFKKNIEKLSSALFHQSQVSQLRNVVV